MTTKTYTAKQAEKLDVALASLRDALEAAMGHISGPALDPLDDDPDTSLALVQRQVREHITDVQRIRESLRRRTR